MCGLHLTGCQPLCFTWNIAALHMCVAVLTTCTFSTHVCYIVFVHSYSLLTGLTAICSISHSVCANMPNNANHSGQTVYSVFLLLHTLIITSCSRLASCNVL